MKNSQRIFSLAQVLITVDQQPLHLKHFALYKLRHARYEMMRALGLRCRRVYGTPKDWK